MSSIYLSLLIPLYLEGVAGFTPFIAGCLLAPATLCYAGLCFVSGRMLGKVGVWPLVPVGFGVCLLVRGACGVHAARSCAGHRGLMALACAGIGTEYPAIKSVDSGSARPRAVRERSSIHSTLVQIAGSIRRRSSSVSCRGRFII